MNPAACSLDADELAEQLERYRAIGRLAAAVEQETGRVIVSFAGDPPSALIEQTVEVWMEKALAEPPPSTPDNDCFPGGQSLCRV